MESFLQFSAPSPASLPRLAQPNKSGCKSGCQTIAPTRGAIGERAVEILPAAEKRVNSEHGIWTGMKLIAAWTCKNVFCVNEKILTLAFLGAFACLLKSGPCSPSSPKLHLYKGLFNFAKFLEFAIEKKEFKIVGGAIVNGFCRNRYINNKG
jgi:hypothetical protein